MIGISSITNFVYQVLRTARPRQWLKNVSLFAAPVFSGLLFEGDVFWNTTKGVFAMCVISSGIYFLNDISDAEKDKLHPVKKNRPIPSGKITLRQAKMVTALLLAYGIYYSATYVGTFFLYAILAYVLIQFAYSFAFRNVIIMDALIVSAGFIVRVFAGGLAAEASVSSWLVLTTIGVSLLIAFGKRRSEKTLLSKQMSLDRKQIDTRKALRDYPDNLLDSMISMSASFCIITYALFTFQVSPENVNPALYNILPSILRSPKWMMLTIPIVIYGVGRYLYVIYEKEEGESPARVLLNDKPLLASVVIWGIAVLMIIYLVPLVFNPIA